MGRNSTVGSAMRNGLADISNLPQQAKLPTRFEKLQPNFLSTKEYIDQLHKENMELKMLLADRNRFIELSGVELQKMRINLQKVQQQNLQLAQANNHMLTELNSSKDRLKVLHHEVECKNGLFQALKVELEERKTRRTKKCHETGIEEEKMRREMCKKCGGQVGNAHCKDAVESFQAQEGDDRPQSTKKKRPSKHQSLGPHVQQVKANVPSENKRLCLRRQSARFVSEDHMPARDLFEIDDAKFPVDPLLDDLRHENSDYGTKESRRSSVTRPSRRAAERIQSYKEIPLNVKMRRTN